ncbi:Protein of unknown function [Gryllus bimaculatus]|nr:Protein of unknown function [Gryllus bimaculatus]
MCDERTTLEAPCVVRRHHVRRRVGGGTRALAARPARPRAVASPCVSASITFNDASAAPPTPPAPLPSAPPRPPPPALCPHSLISPPPPPPPPPGRAMREHCGARSAKRAGGGGGHYSELCSPSGRRGLLLWPTRLAQRKERDGRRRGGRTIQKATQWPPRRPLPERANSSCKPVLPGSGGKTDSQNYSIPGPGADAMKRTGQTCNSGSVNDHCHLHWKH